MDRREFLGGVASNLLAAPLAVFGKPLAQAKRRSVKAATSLSTLAANTVVDLGPYANASVSGGNSITDYSSITYDPVGKRMLIFGGGHGPGNETDIRSFDLTTLTWSSLYPSTPFSDMTLANCDSDRGRWISTNHPFARHSYNLTQVIGRRFYMTCCRGMPYINGIAEPQWGGRICWYDFDSGTWTYSQNTRAQTPWHEDSASVLDPVSGKILVVGLDANYQSTLWLYDPATDTFVTGPKWTPSVGISLELVYVPDNDRFYAIFSLDGRVWEISLNRANLNLSTATLLPVNANLPAYTGSPPSGYAYDPYNKIIGGFVVNGVFSAFDPFAKKWTQKQMIDAATGSAATHSQYFYCIDFDRDSGCFIFLGKAGSLTARTFAYRYGPNYQGLWWNAPANSEPYWGISLAHQGDYVFATWYTYDMTGKPWWLSMLAGRDPDATNYNTYFGTIYQDTGPPFDAFVGKGTPAQVGSGTLIFSDADNGSFSYSVSGAAQTKIITRFDLGTGPQPTCAYSALPHLAGATNYQDLWWDSGGAEPGWAVSLAHQGDSVFATWYTYGSDNAPLWLSALAQRVETSKVYTGTLYQTSGPRFDAYDGSKAMLQPVGTATFTFADGNNASFSYKTSGAGGLPAVNQTKQIARYRFTAPWGTVCD